MQKSFIGDGGYRGFEHYSCSIIPLPHDCRLLICFDKLIFPYSADGTFKVIRQIFELHSERDAEFPLAFFVVYPTAYFANVLFHFDLSFLFIFPCRSTVMPPISHKIYNQKSINTSSQSCFYDIERLFIRPILPSPPRKKRRITVAHGIQYRLLLLPAFLLGKAISNAAPFALYEVIFPPCIFTISFVSASPMPVFPFLPV